MNIMLLFFCLFSSLTTTVLAVNHEANLHKYLFMPEENSTVRYDPNVRPVRDSFKRVDVELRLGIKRLFEMDEYNQKVTIFAILIKKWKDDFLAWDPKDFGNITFTYVKYDQIWSPKLTLVSKFTDERSSAMDHSAHEVYENFPVKLSSNGSVEFIPTLHLESDCIFNYRLFPFEYQMCDFHFQMPYNLDQVALRMATFYTQELYKYTPMWRIENVEQVTTTDEARDPISIVRISFKRSMGGYLYTMPSYIVYILTLLMFLLPQQSSQRIIIGSACLVISSLLIFMMANSLPKNDISAWPLLGKLYLFNIILLAFSLVFSTFIINISNSQNAKAVPDWLKRFTINVLSKIFCVQAVAYTVFNAYSFKAHDAENNEQINNMISMSPLSTNLRIRFQKVNSQDTDDTANIQTESTEIPLTSSQTRQPRKSQKANTTTALLKSIHDHMNQLRDRFQIEMYKQCASNEWLLVAILFDKIFFFVYCFVVIFITTFIFKK